MNFRDHLLRSSKTQKWRAKGYIRKLLKIAYFAYIFARFEDKSILILYSCSARSKWPESLYSGVFGKYKMEVVFCRGKVRPWTNFWKTQKWTKWPPYNFWKWLYIWCSSVTLLLRSPNLVDLLNSRSSHEFPWPSSEVLKNPKMKGKGLYKEIAAFCLFCLYLCAFWR